MKRIAIFILGLLLLSTVVNAQFTTNASTKLTNPELTVTFGGVVDTLGGADSVLTSSSFAISDYDGSTNFGIYYLLTSTGALTPSVTAILYASEDNSSFTATTDTLMNTVTAETAKWASFTITGRAAYYKLKIFSNSGGSDATFAIKLRLPLKEPKIGR